MATANVLPEFDGRALWLMTENQGVCVWGVPLDAGDDPPVLVGGDLQQGTTTVSYAPSIGAFALATARDRVLLGAAPLLQAQVDPLDEATRRYLDVHFTTLEGTFGWPCPENLRFQSDRGVTLLLWSCARQCDWWFTGSDPTALREAARDLLEVSSLASDLWSNDDEGMALLEDIR